MRKTWLKVLAWYSALLTLMPLAAVPTPDFRSSWGAALYAVLVFGIITAFAVLAPARRRTLLLWVVTLALVQLLGVAPFEWERIVVLGLLVTAAVVLVEVARQNLSMVDDLRQPRAALTENLAKGLVLWLPMLVAAYLGYLGQGWLERTSIEVAYTLTPIDAYCRVGNATLPCEGLTGGGSDTKQALSLASNIDHHLQALYRARQIDLLSRISSVDTQMGVPDDSFNDPQRLAATLNQLGQAASPGQVVGIRADGSQTPAEVLASDAQLKALESRLAQLRTEPAVQYIPRPCRFVRVIGECVDVPPIAISTEPEIRRLSAAIEQRRADVLANARSRLVAPEVLQGSLARQIGRVLLTIEKPLDGAGLLVSEPNQILAARALLAARVMAKLDREEAQVKQATQRIAGEIDAGIATGAFAGVPPAAVQLASLSVPAYCTLAAPSPTVYADATFTGRATINRGVFLCRDVTALQQGHGERLNFDQSVDESILRWRADAEVALEAATRKGLAQTVEKTSDASAGANALADTVPVRVDLGREHCTTLEPSSWINCLTNIAKESAEDGYQTAHRQGLRRYRDTVERFKHETQRSGAEVLLFERTEMRNQILAAEANLRKTVNFSRQAAQVVSLLLLALLCIALVKSLLYIVALVIFDFRGPSLVQVDGASPIEGGPPMTGASDHRIDIDDLRDQELITKAQLDNQAVHTVIAPWKYSAFLARLLRGKYFGFNRGGPYQAGRPIYFSYGNGKHIVDWKLRPGEEVIFSYAHFFGASSNVVLRSRISFKLSTILLGRLVFHSAQAQGGPGHLLLLTNSIAKTVADGGEIEAAEPERLIAWHPHAKFRVQNELTLRSIVMDPFALVRISDLPNPGRALFESPRRNIRLFSGTFRYLKRLLSPF